jgi:preprotein translocase subunit SecE
MAAERRKPFMTTPAAKASDKKSQDRKAQDRKAPDKKETVRKPRIGPGEFLRQVRAEANKVVWPTRQETTSTAIFVGVMMSILALFFLGIDTAFGALVRWLLTLA